MNEQAELDYGVIRERKTGKTMAVLIKYSTVTDIVTTVGAYPHFWWDVLYRGSKGGYEGPPPMRSIVNALVVSDSRKAARKEAIDADRI